MVAIVLLFYFTQLVSAWAIPRLIRKTVCLQLPIYGISARSQLNPIGAGNLFGNPNV